VTERDTQTGTTTSAGPVDTTTEPPRPESPLPPDDLQATGLAIEARTSGQLVRRRFFRHRAAMISLGVLMRLNDLFLTYRKSGG
jgi:hypothetical protein